MPTTKGRAYNCPPMPAHRLAAVKREAAIMARGTDAKKGTRNKEAMTALNKLKRAARHRKAHRTMRTNAVRLGTGQQSSMNATPLSARLLLPFMNR